MSATSGRLGGLLGGCGALLRHATPEGAPLENVPKRARSVGGTFSRAARPPVRAVTCSGEHPILVPRGAREGAHRWDVRHGGPTGAVPGDRRPLLGGTLRAAFSAAPGVRHARFGEPRLAVRRSRGHAGENRRQLHRQKQRQRQSRGPMRSRSTVVRLPSSPSPLTPHPLPLTSTAPSHCPRRPGRR
jgi:hypothetical protein